MLQGQPLHPIKHAVQLCTDPSKEGWGSYLNDHTARGTWSLAESKQHINYLELKRVFLAPKEFQILQKQHSPDSHVQYHSGCLHKQRGDEIRPSM